ITPSAACKPNADPPDSTIASSRPMFPGSSNVVSRVPGAPPRTSTAAGTWRSNTIAVQPLRLSRWVVWPILNQVDSGIDYQPRLRYVNRSVEFLPCRGKYFIVWPFRPEMGEDQLPRA